MKKSARVALSALSVSAFMASPATGWTQERLCQFTTTAPSGAPTIVGPNDVTSRLHVIDQPDSPVEIVSADFTGTQLVVEEGTITRSYSFQHRAVVEVRNRSDRAIERIYVSVMPGVCEGVGPRPRDSWTGNLPPGDTTRIQLGTGSGGGSGSFGASMGPLLVWAWIERVDFGSCVYRPAQVVPKELCEARSRSATPLW
jgi:hypothetical protein